MVIMMAAVVVLAEHIGVTALRSVPISAGTPAILTKVSRRFPQFSHANAGIQPLPSESFPVYHSPMVLTTRRLWRAIVKALQNHQIITSVSNSIA